MRRLIVAASAGLFGVATLACVGEDLHDCLQPEHRGGRDDRIRVTVVAKDVLFIPE